MCRFKLVFSRLIVLVGTLSLASSDIPSLANPPCYFIQDDGEILDLSHMCVQPENSGEIETQSLSPGEEYYNLAFEQLEAGALNAAIESFSLAIAVDPTNEGYYQQRASTFAKAGDIESARADYEALKQLYISAGGDDPDVIRYYDILKEMI